MGGVNSVKYLTLCKKCVYLTITNNMVTSMELKEILELILILLGVREVREYRRMRHDDIENSRKDADDGKNHSSTR